ncbi:hypothetical protein AB1Y20_003795 [Prymnesium parvum]|uniref:Elongin-C n=1 Tax=Prymnesium parvum TaxID=97485 RepID=A0AB34J5Q0_PRYPA
MLAADPTLKQTVVQAQASARARNSMDPIKLIASDDSEIILDRRAAMVSGTIKNMLSGAPCDGSQFTESQQGEVKFKEMNAATLEKVVQYFYYKLRHTNHVGPLPEFKIEPEAALELLMAANYLDT